VRQPRQQQLNAWQRKPQPDARATKGALLGWDIYLTHAPVHLLSAAEGLAGAQWRGQIELRFKLWKSERLLDSGRSDNPWRILCEVYAKLMAVIGQPGLILMGAGHPFAKSLVQMSRTIQKKAWHLASVLSHPQAFRLAWADLHRGFTWGCRIRRSASSPPTFQRLQGFS
jgi:hypothetical protein